MTAACSRKEKPDSQESIPQAEMSAAAVNSEADLIVEDQDKTTAVAEEPKIEEKAVVAEEAVDLMQDEAKSPKIKEESFGNATLAGEVGTYKVEKGETLMMIAFKIYGDYGMWRELAKLNPKIKSFVIAGMSLNFKAPAEKFVWNPAGEPYLIRKGDTLGVISNEKYGTPKKWKKIWENNKPLIKNPNLIFAGFTLYYIPENKLADTN